ncbi:uncharacterized protein LOC106175573 [Lingula anatina]|uniref:Uncharacterized protein LOC106175573 n=1 Tax=Lingula anatina TaxID=7574 RepID=A0A1S3JRZ8_LINAN|nr:uncharacterized protein LOC106175573 [Lingula anatina]|eukprot:XP_013413092.1 uncharacterized protein LOC106175573 [Lingula anatina]
MMSSMAAVALDIPSLPGFDDIFFGIRRDSIEYTPVREEDHGPSVIVYKEPEELTYLDNADLHGIDSDYFDETDSYSSSSSCNKFKEDFGIDVNERLLSNDDSDLWNPEALQKRQLRTRRKRMKFAK